MTTTAILCAKIKANLADLNTLLDEMNDHGCGEDLVYRMYHHSFKVYGIQGYTLRMVDAFQKLDPGTGLNKEFLEIVQQGTRKKFNLNHNHTWLKHTRPMVEAFFHAHYFLTMLCRYGKELTEDPQVLPSGWAAILYLFNAR